VHSKNSDAVISHRCGVRDGPGAGCFLHGIESSAKFSEPVYRFSCSDALNGRTKRESHTIEELCAGRSGSDCIPQQELMVATTTSGSESRSPTGTVVTARPAMREQPFEATERCVASSPSKLEEWRHTRKHESGGRYTTDHGLTWCVAHTRAPIHTHVHTHTLRTNLGQCPTARQTGRAGRG
jgi:hypothetical protein